MRKVLLLLFFFLLFVKPIFAQQPNSTFDQLEQGVPKTDYSRGRVVKILEEGTKKIAGSQMPFQRLIVKIEIGPDKGKEIEIDQGILSTMKEAQRVRVGEEVVVSRITNIAGSAQYFITDRYRIPLVVVLLIVFFVLVVYFGRIRGFTSFLGLIVSIFILLKFVVPQIFAGNDPLLISFLGALAIAFTSLYLAHGFNKRTTIALVSTVITLFLSIIIAQLFVYFAKLTGLGNEDAYYLQQSVAQGSFINAKGLLLGGIIIGALGVLDDITIGQAASIEELSRANSDLTFHDLYARGLSIGREHIASLVNTLVLAYAGASFPIFFLFLMLKDVQPIWVTVNNEFLMEEVVRTLVGSTTIVLAVPLTTLFAAYIFSRKKIKKSK